jgi:hypothetical protein
MIAIPINHKADTCSHSPCTCRGLLFDARVGNWQHRCRSSTPWDQLAWGLYWPFPWLLAGCSLRGGRGRARGGAGGFVMRVVCAHSNSGIGRFKCLSEETRFFTQHIIFIFALHSFQPPPERWLHRKQHLHNPLLK